MNERELFQVVLEEKVLGKLDYIRALFTIPYMADNANYKSEILNIKDNKITITFPTRKVELDYYKFPILDYLDNVTITPDMFKSIDKELETSIGIVMCNLLIIEEPFSGKIKFIDGVITDSIEDYIAANLVSNNYVFKSKEEEQTKIKVSELIRFVDQAQYLKTLSRFFVVASSKKTLLPPPGIQEKKLQLVKDMIKELGPDAFKQQVNIVKLENELKKIDAEWLKDDPTFGIVTSGKVLSNSRKELFLTVGGIEAFDENDDLSFVLNSLLEGWPSDPDLMTAIFNSLRNGSLARALDTQYGGLFAKVILRAIGSYIIKPELDCGTKLGKLIKVNDSNYKSIINRHIIFSNETILVESEDISKQYMNKSVLIRSPKYCQLEGEKLCGKCVNKLLNDNVDGIKNEVTAVTSNVLNEAMKAMHNTTKQIVRLVKSEIFS